MPSGFDAPGCLAVRPSAASELGWILDLLLATAPYGQPALAELDDSLLPGITSLREPTREKSSRLWTDALPGCPELVLVAQHAGCLLDQDAGRLLEWFARTTNHAPPDFELLTEPLSSRDAVDERLRLLCRDGPTRSRYSDMIEPVWQAMRTAWQRDGLRTSLDACEVWRGRVAGGGHIEDLVAPRHPLTHPERFGWDELWAHRSSYAVSPLYFCLSGGHAVDLGEYVHVAVPANDLLPVRKIRDAMFVANRLRVLAEPTRVHILIQLMSAPSGVMDLARSLRISQPTVSAHVKVLENAGLLQARRVGLRNVFIASRKRVERLLEDARGTLARWD
jgi:DNA-binding transcriptional ArsR family regulator